METEKKKKKSKRHNKASSSSSSSSKKDLQKTDSHQSKSAHKKSSKLRKIEPSAIPSDLDRDNQNLPSKSNVPPVDPELDNIFKSSKFPPLQALQASKPALTTEENPIGTPASDKKNSHPDRKISTVSKSKSSSKISKSKNPKKRKQSVELSYEIKLAIQRAKAISEQLKAQAKVLSDFSSKPSPTVLSNKLENLIQTDSQHNSLKRKASNANESCQDADEHSITTNSCDSSSDSRLVHETLTGSSSTSSKSQAENQQKTKSNETPEERNARTIYVGNVHIACVKNKSSQKKLLKHLLHPLSEEAPLATKSRIESFRFRSIPLSTPAGPAGSEPRENQHSLERSKAWKKSRSDSGTAFDDVAGGSAGRRGARPLPSSETTEPTVQFLTPSQKRKVGYITGDVHPDAKSCIAYVVIAHPRQKSDGSKDMTAEELAELIATKCDGKMFMDRVLRCDLASKAASKKEANQANVIDVEEQRRTLFLGGIDFLEDEDSIRAAVESRLIEEKHELPAGATSWVERVRVVRDKSTSLTKGFAYVLLRTREAAEEMLALPEDSFRINKRAVRVQKYLSRGHSSALKRLGGSTTNHVKGKKTKANPTSRESVNKKPRIDLRQEIDANYKGPDQSKELSNLSKSERKTIKSNNPARVERRILKKHLKLKVKLLGDQKDRKTDEFNPSKRRHPGSKNSKSAGKSKAKTKLKPKSKPT